MAPKLWKRAAGRFNEGTPGKNDDEEQNTGRGFGRYGGQDSGKEEPLGGGRFGGANEEVEQPQEPDLTGNRYHQLDNDKVETLPGKGTEGLKNTSSLPTQSLYLGSKFGERPQGGPYRDGGKELDAESPTELEATRGPTAGDKAMEKMNKVTNLLSEKTGGM